MSTALDAGLATKRRRPRRSRFDPARIGLYVLLVLFAIIFLVPVYVLLTSSLKTFAEVQDLSRMWSLPQTFTLESFRAAWSGIPEKGLRGLSTNLLNSIYLTVQEGQRLELATRLRDWYRFPAICRSFHRTSAARPISMRRCKMQ